MSVNPPEIKEMLFADEYWDGPVYDPDTYTDGWSTNEKIQHTNDRIASFGEERAQEIGNIVLSLIAGGKYIEIKSGGSLPMPRSNERQVLKVVEDTRMLIPRFRRKSRRSKYSICSAKIDQTIQKIFDDIPYFDTVADIMTNPTAYTDTTVSALRKIGKDTVVVTRSVGYMRAGQGVFGSLLQSAFIDDGEISELAYTSAFYPELRVGTIYKSDRNEITKIAAAALLEAEGAVWNHPRSGGNSKKKEQKDKRRVWLPLANPAVT